MATNATTTLLTAASTLAAGAYINARLSLSTDYRQLKHDKSFGARLGQRIQELGDECSLYGVFNRVDPALEALWFEGNTWTYGQLNDAVIRLATFLEGEGVGKENHVAVMTSNSPEMVIVVLALSRLGAVAGLINTSLRGDVLKHCLDISTAQVIISTPDLSEFLPTDRKHFSINLSSFTTTSPQEDNSPIKHLSLSALPLTKKPSPPARNTPRDAAFLIFTSGTTGKPKACTILNNQVLITSTPHPLDFFNPKKYFPLRTYSPLPLFHGTAIFTGLCYVIGSGGTFCLARRFSASNFFKDVHASGATRMLYVGELCRYLFLSRPSKWDKGHNCIVAMGNGLRKEIWEGFKTRFGISEIREFYRSTEGLGKFDNFATGMRGVGMLGFHGGVLRKFMVGRGDTVIVRVDKSDDGDEFPFRDPATGFCVEAAKGEAGEVLGRVKDRGLLTAYLHDEPATEKKLMRDVFEKGDCWQRMGDLVIRDEEGWVSFHDRIGESFRWKGENVSAGEVRDYIAKLDGVLDAVVWGVKLESYDGQAGAAAITLDSGNQNHASFMSSFYTSLKKVGLPSYAVPRLVRIQKEIESNATFKKSKKDIVKKSWNVRNDDSGDILYFLEGDAYRRLDGEAWSHIEKGRARL